MENIRKVYYRSYRPAGWSDDLGIMADRNTWLDVEYAGWVVEIAYPIWPDIVRWLDDNQIRWELAHPLSYCVLIKNYGDLSLLLLTWHGSYEDID